MKTLKGKFLLTFVALIALNAAGALIVSRTVASQRSDALVINLAGAQRMLSQKMTKELLVMIYAGEVHTDVKNLIARFGRVLRGLKLGDTELGLPPCGDSVILAQLEVVEKLWLDLKLNLERPLIPVLRTARHSGKS